jgi:hypothetical protein
MQFIRALLLAGLVIVTVATGVASGETIRLQDGTTINGTIEKETGDTVIIVTSVGTLTIPREEITTIEYTTDLTLNQDLSIGMDRVAAQVELMRLERRRELCAWALGSVFSTTIAADVAMGGTFYPGSAVPVVGPFWNAVALDGDDYGPNKDGMTRDRVLFILSGVAQAACLYDMLITNSRISKLERRYNLSFLSDNPGIVISFVF